MSTSPWAIRLRAGEPNRYNVVLRRVLQLAGRTRDENGIALPFCATHLFRTDDDVEKGQAVSDANGDYAFEVFDLRPHYVLATKYTEWNWGSDAPTFDATFPSWFDIEQVGGVTANNRKGI